MDVEGFRKLCQAAGPSGTGVAAAVSAAVAANRSNPGRPSRGLGIGLKELKAKGQAPGTIDLRALPKSKPVPDIGLAGLGSNAIGMKRRHTDKSSGQGSTGPGTSLGLSLTPAGGVVEPQSFSSYSASSAYPTIISEGSTGRKKKGGGAGVKVKGGGHRRKDLTQYAPVKKLQIPEDHTRIYTVANGITDETLVVTLGQFSIHFYRLRITELKEESKKKREVELIRVHEIEVENRYLGEFAISSDVSVTLPPRKLVYAVAPFGTNLVYHFDFTEETFLPEKINLDDANLVEKYGESMKIFDNGQPTTEMAIKNDHYLACILSNRVVVVWEIATESKLCSFQLTAEGVHISWHPSEAYKLFVVEASGYAKFFNVMKERCYMVQNLCHSPLYSGDWGMSNSLHCVVGWGGGFTSFNTSESNSNMSKVYEQPCRVFNKVKFNPLDVQSIATLERGHNPSCTVRLWRKNLPHCLWSFSKEQIIDLDWVFGKSYILALGFKKILVFDAKRTT